MYFCYLLLCLWNNLAASVSLPLQSTALAELVSILEHCYENKFLATSLSLV